MRSRVKARQKCSASSEFVSSCLASAVLFSLRESAKQHSFLGVACSRLEPYCFFSAPPACLFCRQVIARHTPPSSVLLRGRDWSPFSGRASPPRNQAPPAALAREDWAPAQALPPHRSSRAAPSVPAAPARICNG